MYDCRILEHAKGTSCSHECLSLYITCVALRKDLADGRLKWPGELWSTYLY